MRVRLIEQKNIKFVISIANFSTLVKGFEKNAVTELSGRLEQCVKGKPILDNLSDLEKVTEMREKSCAHSIRC